MGWSSFVFLGRTFFFNDFLKLKISNYTFSFLKTFNFFKPFGFVDFLQKMFDLSYHYKYRSEFHLYVNNEQTLDKKSIFNSDINFDFYKKF